MSFMNHSFSVSLESWIKAADLLIDVDLSLNVNAIGFKIEQCSEVAQKKRRRDTIIRLPYRDVK